ncbi:hypothetical protein J4221_04140 [Candidatus Pacearchaeota archaeon]|nr:hypothetical protein [Candidatus Pacearchaeota archaeon]
MKGRGVHLFLILLLVIFIAGVMYAGVIAQENVSTGETPSDEDIESSETGGSQETLTKEFEGTEEVDEEPLEEEFSNEIEEIEEIDGEESEEEDLGDIDTGELDAGITPDSFFYFIDEFFDRFGSCVENREEKIAEIKAMVEEGKIDDAKKALERYEHCAENVEKEASPGEKERIEKGSKIIKKAIRNIKDKIPEEDRKDFEDIIDKEERIEKAVKIASKIKDLCEELSKLDPLEYSRVCKIDDKVPEWRKVHDKKLTEEQRKEAKEFGEIMRECMRTSGKECRCEEIDFVPMSNMCSTAKPLAIKCDDGDETSCEELNNLEFPEMPDYLLEVMDNIERNVKVDQFEKHMPRECIEEGADNSQKCIELMFRRNAPGPCLNALDRGEISFKNEREAREACEKIMFEENAPEECIEAGLRDPKECGKLMFQRNAPEECIEAGLTGEHKDDPRKCEKLMREKGDFGPPDHAVAAGFRCKNIENSDERLKCFDEALKSVEGRGKEHYDYSNEQRGPPGGWPEPCERTGARTRESCEKIMRAEGDRRFEETKEGERACVEQCSSEGKAWDFSNGECKCREGERRDYQEFYKQGEDLFKQRQDYERNFAEECSSRGGRWDCSNGQCNCVVENVEQQPSTTPTPSEEPTTTQEQPSTTTTQESGTSGESGGSSGSSDSGSEGGITGGVIFDNEFLDYYYR